MAAELYHRLGGQDERFRGWGWEDREFWRRLKRATDVQRFSDTLLHLDHPRPPMQDDAALANQRLFESLSRDGATAVPAWIGDAHRYARELTHVPQAAATLHATSKVELGRRACERWWTWHPTRIEQIVQDELRAQSRVSVRAQLAEIVSQLGDSVLDVGCGPGAMWPHFQRFRPRLTWQGVDSTAPMLSVARRLFPDVDAHHADASALPFDDASFDVVLLRHVLEHVPEWVMRAALKEATRVARSVVVVAFHVPASDAEPTHVSRVGEGFLQTRWSRTDVLAPIERAGWRVAERCSISDPTDARDAVWLLRPASRRKALPSLQTPKVSIVMPTLRRPHTIFRTIRSAASDANSPRRRGLPVAIVTISCTSSRSWRVTAGPRRRATS